MSLTISNWVEIGTLTFIVSLVVIGIWLNNKDVFPRFASISIGILIVVGAIFGLNWYNTNTASGQRYFKEFKSNINNGLKREITITAEDGRQIFHYEGKFDVEDEGQEKHIVFENEQGKRIVIYYGITDTVIIEEK